MAQQIITDSARLEGKVAPETAGVLGDKLSLINSYYSNLIEGHKTTIVDIEAAMQNRFDKGPDRKYAQELCAAHVQVEKKQMRQITASQVLPISSRQYLCDLHRSFYTCLTEEHLYTHTGSGLTQFTVNPGELRDVNVSVDGRSFHGPHYQYLPK
jgi:Fic family protein